MTIASTIALLPSIASAHPLAYGAIITHLVVNEKTITLESGVPMKQYGLTHDDLLRHYRTYVPEHFRITADGDQCPFTLSEVDTVSDTNKMFIRGTFLCTHTIQNINDLAIQTTLFGDLYENYDHFVTLSLQESDWSLVFGKGATSFPGHVEAHHTIGPLIARTFAIISQFIWMGMLHIFSGYDHILFLISIVLLARSLKNILVLVTAFTLAHSVTLILAAFHIIEISSRFVEPAIALTIALVAIQNFRQLRGAHDAHLPTERWAGVFVFGLIHGLGFASALSDSNIPSSFFVPALISFNVGIEIGQLAILSVLFPILLQIDKTKHRKEILLLISALTITLALAWLVARIVFNSTCTAALPLLLQFLCI